MTPEEGYQEALRRIEAARKSGAKGLRLQGLELTELPSEINELRALSLLSIDRNNLTSLPSTIGAFRDLNTLTAGGNQLALLPPEIGSLTSLTKLVLSDNELRRLPPTFKRLQSLEYLYLENNQLKELPFDLKALEGLWVEGNPLEPPYSSLLEIKNDHPSEFGEKTAIGLSYTLATVAWQGMERSKPPEIPAQIPAPSQFVVRKGRIAVAPPPPLDAPTDETALQEKHAYLREEAAHWAGEVGDNSPHVRRALRNYHAALGETLGDLNVIRAGAAGRAVTSLADVVKKETSEEIAALYASFATDVALFIQRFPAWVSYESEDAAPKITGDLGEAQTQAGVISDAIKATPGVFEEKAGAIIKDLSVEILDGEDVEYTLQQRAWFDTLKNALLASADTLKEWLEPLRKVGGERLQTLRSALAPYLKSVSDFSKKTGDKAKSFAKRTFAAFEKDAPERLGENFSKGVAGDLELKKIASFTAFWMAIGAAITDLGAIIASGFGWAITFLNYLMGVLF